MPWSVKKPTAAEVAPDWLQPHCKEFMRKLTDQGYARCSLRTYDRAVTLFCSEVGYRGIRCGQLAGGTLTKVRAAVLGRINPNKYDQKKYCLDRFIDALVEAGMAKRPLPPRKAPTAMDRLRVEYSSYLRNQRGLSEGTIRECVRYMEQFMTFRFGATLGKFDDITAADIADFLRKIMRGEKPSRNKTPPTHLRNLFRFLFWSGKTKGDLANAVPRVAQPPESHLPRYLKPEAVEQLVDTVWSADPVGRRNYAMLLLIARLGLRAPEVIAQHISRPYGP